jgi:hypothetical protein
VKRLREISLVSSHKIFMRGFMAFALGPWYPLRLFKGEARLQEISTANPKL